MFSMQLLTFCCLFQSSYCWYMRQIDFLLLPKPKTLRSRFVEGGRLCNWKEMILRVPLSLGTAGDGGYKPFRARHEVYAFFEWWSLLTSGFLILLNLTRSKKCSCQTEYVRFSAKNKIKENYVSIKDGKSEKDVSSIYNWHKSFHITKHSDR